MLSNGTQVKSTLEQKTGETFAIYKALTYRVSPFLLPPSSDACYYIKVFIIVIMYNNNMYNYNYRLPCSNYINLQILFHKCCSSISNTNNSIEFKIWGEMTLFPTLGWNNCGDRMLSNCCACCHWERQDDIYTSGISAW